MEIAGLRLNDVITGGDRPCIRVRKDNTKGRNGQRKARRVPLWWDAGTLEDIRAWIQYRIAHGAQPDWPVIYGQRVTPLCGNNSPSAPLTEASIAKRWQTSLLRLGRERSRQVSIHGGRHSFCSHSLAAGRSLVEVRDSAGHANINTTSIYLHYIERAGIPDVFATLPKGE